MNYSAGRTCLGATSRRRALVGLGGGVVRVPFGRRRALPRAADALADRLGALRSLRRLPPHGSLRAPGPRGPEAPPVLLPGLYGPAAPPHAACGPPRRLALAAPALRWPGAGRD